MKKVRFLKDSNSFEITNDFGDKEIIKKSDFKNLHRSICCDQHITFLSEYDYKALDKVTNIDTENYWRFYYSIEGNN